MAFVRSSKFRHIYGQPLKSDVCYNGIRTEGTGDTNCAVSGKFIAIIKGSKIFILPLEKYGRQEENQLPYIDCKAKVLDVQWSPFHDCLLASAEESGAVNTWLIPDSGLKENIDEPFVRVDNQVHSKKVTCLQWHPSADFILAVAGSDTFVTVWNTSLPDNVPIVQIQDVGEMPTNLAWNRDGSVLGITSKVGRTMSLKLVNAHTGEVIATKSEIYSGMKAAKIAFLNNGKVLTVSADRTANRTINVWKRKDTADKEENLEEEYELELNSGSGVLNIYYDYDLKILYTFAKGESAVSYYEINEDNGEIFYLSAYTSTVSQKGGNFMPKRCMDTSKTEVARFYKLQPAKCEPIPLIVPRKSDHFQKDLYPDCPSDQAALEAEQWVKGADSMPLTMKFGESFTATKKSAPLKAPARVLTKVPAKANIEAVQEVPAGIDLAELVEDMKKVKATVRKLNKRVTKLEEMLEQKGVDANREEEEEE